MLDEPREAQYPSSSVVHRFPYQRPPSPSPLLHRVRDVTKHRHSDDLDDTTSSIIMGTKGFEAMDIESSNGLASKAAKALSPARTRMGALVVALILGVLFVVLVVSFAQTSSIRVDSDLPASVAALMNVNALPCSDFYEFACGGWLANTSLPPDRPSFSRSFSGIQDANDDLFRTILAEKWPLVSDLYDSCMNTSVLDALGAAPLGPDLNAIRSTKSKHELLALVGALSMKSGMNFLFPAYIDVDEQRGHKMVLHVEQGGITLPDREDYVNTTRFTKLDAPYRSMITSLMTLAGWSDDTVADTVVSFETVVAQAMLPKAALRDPNATYNPTTNISGTYPSMYVALRGANISLDDTTRVIVVTPAFFRAAETLLRQSSLQALQSVVAFQFVLASSGGLAASFRNATFAFFGQTIYGLQTMRPRSQQCTDKVNHHLGELMARYYIQRKFHPESLESIQDLVDDIRSTFRSRLERNHWMDDSTRATAVSKLDAMTQLLGYPTTRDDYPVVLTRSDYFGNIQTLTQLNHMRAVTLLHTEVDKTRWSMPAHAVNAYYNPTFNQIVFPAGILQPPFFDVDADAAMNYGAIGMVIGHEITHGFDDQGRNFNGDGLLQPWWSDSTAAQFQDKAKCIVDQYANMPVYGHKATLLGMVNGQLTLGETIADVGGLAVAFQAYAVRMKKAAVNGKTYVRHSN
ncbi:hypothetical protein, variant 1 [Aphanomyces astaci]|uniref:Peptidase M13 N-terminal domain-containing protein n=1 Tax=Aphanomyces astaci TaxID=112090 RepID=W4GVC8_APHAT|nr:hypothetical protein, variant 1 [Aphanomyces astaci]ETV83266.1 hypothetical protein, variant 1 [Aphanomyces astaci]|eukprot:XP_009826698.1 hypothetical protein, variant 1 [Aphanomyces astaci]